MQPSNLLKYKLKTAGALLPFEVMECKQNRKWGTLGRKLGERERCDEQIRQKTVQCEQSAEKEVKGRGLNGERASGSLPPT